MPAFLFMDARTGVGGTTCAVYRYVNGTPQQVGDTFGTWHSTADVTSATRNWAIQFQGEIYGMAQDGIYQKDDPTSMAGAWSQVLAFNGGTGNEPRNVGMYPIEIAGVLTLVVLRGDTANTAWRWAKFDGTTWTQASGTLTSASVDSIADVIVYRGVIHVMAEGGVNTIRVFTYDPASDSLTDITSPIGGAKIVTSMCVFMDRLFAISSTTSDIILMEFIGGIWSTIDTIQATASSIYAQAKYCLFTDGTNMYALYGSNATAGTTGWYCAQWDSSLTRTDKSQAVLPLSLLATDFGGGASFSGNITQQRFSAVYDVNTTPGSLAIYLYYSVSGVQGVGFSVFQWNGNASLITQIDTGGDVYHSLPSSYPNNGERIWTAGELDIQITGRLAVPGGEQISFVAWGGGTGRTMKLWYSLDNEPVLLEATLATPVTGGSATLNTGLNQVEGIAADGVTEYTVVWDAQTDGVAQGVQVIRVPEVSA